MKKLIKCCGSVSLAIVAIIAWTSTTYCSNRTLENGTPIKTGVYSKGYGTQGIVSALQMEKNVNVTLIEKGDVELDDLLLFDVVVVGSLGTCLEGTQEALRDYVKCGGGLILNHVACGLTLNDEPLFPEIVSKAEKHGSDALLPCKKQHSILAGMPEQYQYTYGDHFNLAVGPRGETLVQDSSKNSVVVCGSYGKGRVVANGACTGLGSGNKEVAPTGGERQLLLNAVAWAGEGRFGALPQAEREARLTAFRQEKDAQKLLNYDKLMAKRYEWFDESLLRSSFIQRQPVEKTGGRFFLIARVDHLNQYGYERTRQNLRQLKLMGVTDIIQLTMRDCVVFHPTTVPNAMPRYTAYDPLMTLVKAAGKEGVGIWVKLQICCGKVADEMKARDSKGKPYLSGKNDIPDVLNEEYRTFLRRMIDEYATKYNVHKSLKGFYVDMPHSNLRDYLGDNLEDFKKFSMERFGEVPPQDCNMDDLASSCDPTNAWWRRWVLFKQWVNEDFNEFLSDYCHGKGMEYAIQPDPTAGYENGSGWSWGANPYRLSSLAKSSWVFTYPGQPKAEIIYALDQSTSGSFAHGSWGHYNTRSLRGHRAGLDFPFGSHFWRPCMGAMTGRGIDTLRTHILNCREWSGGKVLAKVALLNNQNSLMLRLGQSAPREMQREIDLFEAMSHYFDADYIMVENVELYDRYSVLIAPPYSVNGLSQMVYDKLREFTRNGGVLLNLNAKWLVSREDLTEEKDMTADLTGTPASDTPKAPKDGTLAIVEKAFGKGRVVSVTSHDVLAEMKEGNRAVEKQFADLVLRLAAPPITLKSKSEPHMKIMTTLKKNNWVAVTLWSDDKTPARGIVSVDLKKIGLQHAGYRLLLLGRNMELFKPGDWKGGTQGTANFWTAEDFKAGVAMTILKNDETDLRIPSNIDVSAYPTIWANYIRNIVIPIFNVKDVRQRQYGHEIMVIAPADELNIDGEKAD